jgi:hypothetical protein
MQDEPAEAVGYWLALEERRAKEQQRPERAR